MLFGLSISDLFFTFLSQRRTRYPYPFPLFLLTPNKKESRNVLKALFPIPLNSLLPSFYFLNNHQTFLCIIKIFKRNNMRNYLNKLFIGLNFACPCCTSLLKRFTYTFVTSNDVCPSIACN